MKLEHTTTREGDFFEITDTHGATISLSPIDALLVADWLNSRRGEMFALAHPEIIISELKPDDDWLKP